MDSLTHIALGSCIGELMLGKKLGRKAMVWGLLAASFPDIDALEGLYLALPDELIAHRGITHSLLIAFLAPVAFAWVANRTHRRNNTGFGGFYLFFLLQVLLHDLLDTCNAYGTGLLEPFSSHRFSFNTMYVADPLFSVGITIAAIFLFLYRRNRLVQTRVAATALSISALYLAISVNNKRIADDHLERSLSARNIRATNYFSTPTPFNTLLWYSVAAVDSGFYIGHVSVFDDKTKPVPFNFFKTREYLLDSVQNEKEVKSLKQFASGYYTVERWNDTLVFNVLRFGQMIGWQEPKAHFAFHYYLDSTFSNDLVVQRGRFEGWNRQTLTYMYNRIKGSVEEVKEKPKVLPKQAFVDRDKKKPVNKN